MAYSNGENMVDGKNIEKKHPLYSATKKVRCESRILYDGFIEQVRQFLNRVSYEKEQFYNMRGNSLVYENLLQPIIHARLGLMTRRDVELTLPSEIEDFKKDVDGFGTKWQTFVKNVILNAEVDGISWVKVDYPSVDLKTVSKKDMIDKKIRPFMSLVNAEDVINWKINKRDFEIEYVVVEHSLEDVEHLISVDRLNQLSVNKSVYVIYYRDGYVIYGSKKDSNDGHEEIASGTYTIGSVIFVPFYGIKKDENCGLPTAYSVLNHLKKILNIESQTDHALELINMPRLIITGAEKPDSLPSADNGFFMRIGDNGQKPEIFFAEPSGNGIKLANERVFDLIRRVFRNTLYIDKKDTAQVQSAETLREETAVLKADLSKSASQHEVSSKKCWDLMYMWQTGKKDTKEINVAFNRDFDVRRSTPPEVENIIDLYREKMLSLESSLKELVRSEILPDGFDVQEEIEEIKKKEEAEIQLEMQIQAREFAMKNDGNPEESGVQNGQTSMDDGHSHSYQIDPNGKGKTDFTNDHSHDIISFNVQSVKGHNHSIN
jgi:hypothetical protein